MPVPSHAASCSTKTWPTACPDCTKPVFFFSCTCGSKIFFDDLGAPWPLHYESCLGHRVRVLRNAEGLSLGDVERRIEAEAQRRGTTVPGTVRKLLRSLAFRETGEPTILVLTPGSEEREYLGTITGMNPGVNFFKRLRIEDKPMARMLLGALVQEEHVEVFLRGPVNKLTGFATHVEGFVARSTLERARVSRGQRVAVRLTPRVVGTSRFWIIDEVMGERD